MKPVNVSLHTESYRQELLCTNCSLVCSATNSNNINVYLMNQTY